MAALRTKLTKEIVDALAEEAERCYDLSKAKLPEERSFQVWRSPSFPNEQAWLTCADAH